MITLSRSKCRMLNKAAVTRFQLPIDPGKNDLTTKYYDASMMRPQCAEALQLKEIKGKKQSAQVAIWFFLLTEGRAGQRPRAA